MNKLFKKHKKIGILTNIFNVLDVVTTIMGVVFLGLIEINPITSYFINNNLIGLWGALKVLIVIILVKFILRDIKKFIENKNQRRLRYALFTSWTIFLIFAFITLSNTSFIIMELILNG